jgi:hypothetical protein
MSEGAICGNIGSSTGGFGSGTPKSAVCAFPVNLTVAAQVPVGVESDRLHSNAEVSLDGRRLFRRILLWCGGFKGRNEPKAKRY